MGSFERLKQRMESAGGSIRQSKISDARQLHNTVLQHDPSLSQNTFYWIPGEFPSKGELLQINYFNRRYSFASGNTKEFITPYDQKIEVGDYLYDEDENLYWICTESFNIDGIHYKGKLTECNWKLRWQRPDGVILEYPCQDLNSTQYNSGETGDKTMTLGSAQHMETVQATEDTLNISNPQRFFVSRNYGIPFIVTQNDTTACNYGKGLCKITLTQHLLNQKDNRELGICDYIEPTTPLPPHKTGISTIAGDTELKIGRTRTYTAAFYDTDGIELSGVQFEWHIESDFAEHIAYTLADKTIKISVSNRNYIGSSFLLQIMRNGAVSAETTIQITDIY